MVRQCITVSVFILVINCLLSTWPCLSLFHLSLELPHFYVTWVDDERKVTETHRGVAALPGQRRRALGESPSVLRLVQGQEPCLPLQGDVALTCAALLASPAEHLLLQSACGNLSNFLPKSVKGGGLRLFLRPPLTVPLHLLPSLKKNQVPSPALVRASLNSK